MKHRARSIPPSVRTRLRVDRLTITPSEKRYAILLEGINLHRAISPPLVTVGGVPVESLEFAQDGRTIRGVISRKPRSRRVVIDYGFARAELRS